MSYLGHVKNGVIVFDGQNDLPEGTQVTIDLLGEQRENSQAERPVDYEPLDRLTKISEFWRLLKQFALGMIFLVFMAWIFCDKSLSGFLCTFALLFCAIVIAAGLAMFRMARWAMRKENRLSQFSISTMLLMLFYAGLYLGIIRWITLQSPLGNIGNGDEAMAFLETGIIFTICSIAAIPFIFNLTEALLWFTVWLQKRPLTRRLMVQFLRKRLK
jgi:hypothetical protein